MSKTICVSCYKKASEQANGNEELGQLVFEFLHYEFEHLTKDELTKLLGN